MRSASRSSETQVPEFGVDLLHERVEMDPALFRDRRGAEEQVHQHRLAAPDPAVDVEPLRRLDTAAAQPEALLPAGASGGAGLGLIADQGMMQAFELLRGQFLDGIGPQVAGLQPGPVLRQGSLGHERAVVIFAGANHVSFGGRGCKVGRL